METKGGSGATQNESGQDPWAPGVEYGVCPGPQMPTDDEMSLLSLCICVPRAISPTLGHQNILSTVALFVCTSLLSEEFLYLCSPLAAGVGGLWSRRSRT